MECLLSFLFVLLIVSLVSGWSSSRHGNLYRWNTSYRVLAQKHHGVYTAGGWFSRPSTRFNYGAARVILNSLRKSQLGGSPVTQFQIDWPDSHFICEITPIGTPTRYGLQYVNTLPVATHSATREMYVFSNDLQYMSRLLGSGMRWQLDALCRYANTRQVLLFVNRGRLVVQVSGYLNRPEEVERFTTLCLSIFDQAMLSQAEGIDFVEANELQTLEDAKCQVCGDGIEEEMVFCVRCKTPHHRECWAYLGKCTIYGCGETNYMEPQIAHPVAPRPGPEESDGLDMD